jgi:hypothetical protein
MTQGQIYSGFAFILWIICLFAWIHYGLGIK